LSTFGGSSTGHQTQQRYAKLPEVDLNHLYRSLNILCDHKEELESHLFAINRDLFNMKVDVVFYEKENTPSDSEEGLLVVYKIPQHPPTSEKYDHAKPSWCAEPPPKMKILGVFSR